MHNNQKKKAAAPKHSKRRRTSTARQPVEDQTVSLTAQEVQFVEYFRQFNNNSHGKADLLIPIIRTWLHDVEWAPQFFGAIDLLQDKAREYFVDTDERFMDLWHDTVFSKNWLEGNDKYRDRQYCFILDLQRVMECIQGLHATRWFEKVDRYRGAMS